MLRRFLLATVLTGVFSAAACVAGDVQVWLTTSDGNKTLTRQVDLVFSRNSAARTPDAINLDSGKRYQEIVGFGAALTDASAILIHNLPATQRDALLKELFGRENEGLDFSFTRLTMGASDFSTHHYSFDDQPKGAKDPELKSFSIDPNRADILPVIKAALAVNPDLKVMASPWSAPGWMKSSDSLIQGSLLPEAYPAYADYFRRYIEAYAAEGVPIYALTIQNEPHFEPTDYPGMRVTPQSRAAFIGGWLGPLLARTHPDVRILDWDHNWDEPQSPLAVLADPTAAHYVTGVAWHCYNGTPPAQGTVHDAHPDKETWFTECSGGDWVAAKDALVSSAGTLVETVRYWSKGALLWNIALDEKHGPHLGGCDNCRGVVTIDSATGRITRTVDYYALGHLSRFVAPGAVRIEAGQAPKDLNTVAFRNKDGSTVVVAVNRAQDARTMTVREGQKTFTYDLPMGGVATFVWH
jgi:O-Glycosyl hydrolase